MCTGDITAGRSHYDQALALYDPAEHRSLATRFGQDTRMAILSFRSIALWLLGYPEAALADTKSALGDAREIGQAATLMYALPRSLSFQRSQSSPAGDQDVSAVSRAAVVISVFIFIFFLFLSTRFLDLCQIPRDNA
jgi:hypothetical protein